MKKYYQVPNAEVIELGLNIQILAGSDEYGQISGPMGNENDLFEDTDLNMGASNNMWDK